MEISNEYLNLLFDLYQNLLTDYQKYIYGCYYFDNLSISEISDNENVSRNAIFSLLKRVKKILLDYEDKLKFADKYQRIVELAKNNKELTKVVEILEEND